MPWPLGACLGAFSVRGGDSTYVRQSRSTSLLADRRRVTLAHSQQLQMSLETSAHAHSVGGLGDSFIIEPASGLRSVWIIFLLVALVYNAFAVPFRCSFTDTLWPGPTVISAALLVHAT